MPPHRPKPHVLDLATRSVARLGKKQLWRVVRALRQLPTPPSAESMRESLRDVGIFIPDDSFAAMAADYGADRFDVAALVNDLFGILTPRRRHIVDLVVAKLDPNQTGHITYDRLNKVYDTMRHPAVVTHTRDADDVAAEFFDSFSDPTIPDTDLPVEELMAYYLGISLTTARDEDFELLCVRSFSLDRPKLAFEDELAKLAGSRAVSRQSRMLGEGRTHPLYTTTNEDYGKDTAPEFQPSRHGRSQKFTNNMPPRSGGATGMNM